MDLYLGIAVVLATLLGPVLAICVARRVDDKRRRLARQLDVFRLLMSTRRVPLSADRVRALNLVQIEYHGIQNVEDAYRDLMQLINTLPPLPANWHDRQRGLTTKLLSEMAKVLGYDIQQLDVLEGGYWPQGLVDIEAEQQQVRQVLLEVLSGRRPLLVSPAAPAPPAPFPPPPPP
jgi:hypothetical protein